MSKTKPNYLYKILVSSYALSTFSEGVIMPIYAIFVQKIGGDILEASGAIATFLIVSGLTTIAIHRSKWSQRNRIFLMTYGWLIWVIGIASYFIVSNMITLFISQILVALGNAAADPAFDAELADHTDKNIKSYEWGIFEAMKDIISGIAAILGGLIANLFGFKVLIIVMFIVATISFFMILFYVRISKKKKMIIS